MARIRIVDTPQITLHLDQMPAMPKWGAHRARSHGMPKCQDRIPGATYMELTRLTFFQDNRRGPSMLAPESAVRNVICVWAKLLVFYLLPDVGPLD